MQCFLFSLNNSSQTLKVESHTFSHKIYKITVEIGWVLLASAASGFSGYM